MCCQEHQQQKIQTLASTHIRIQHDIDLDIMRMYRYVWAWKGLIDTKKEFSSRRSSQGALVVEVGLKECANYFRRTQNGVFPKWYCLHLSAQGEALIFRSNFMQRSFLRTRPNDDVDDGRFVSDGFMEFIYPYEFRPRQHGW